MPDRTLCFKVTGEFLTEQARSFWAHEDDPERGLRLLTDGLNGITREQALSVLEGRAKLTGDSSVGIDLAPDDVSGLPTMEDVVRRLHRERDEAEDKFEDMVQLHIGDTVMIPSPTGRRAVPRRKTEVAENGRRLKRRYEWPEHQHAETHEPNAKPLRVFKQVDMGAAGRSWDKDYAREAEMDEPPPTPVDNISTAHGWLDRDGRFYPCAPMGHADLAIRLGESVVSIEEAGWVKVSGKDVFGFIWEKGVTRPTEAQVARVRDYCLTRGCKLPYWAEE